MQVLIESKLISRAFDLLLGGAHWFLEDSNMVSERDRETLFATNSPFFDVFQGFLNWNIAAALAPS